MKRFNKNIILFVFAMAFIALGIFGNCFAQIRGGSLEMIGALMCLDSDGVKEAKAKIEDVSNSGLKYHDTLMDIDSIKNNLLGTRVVMKPDTIVVKSDSGSLCEPVNRLEDSDIAETVSRIKALQELSEANGAHFLYCMAPMKEQYEQLPCNVDNYARDNCERFLYRMRTSEIPTIVFSDFYEETATGEDLFYYTDHHWTARSGFVAYSSLCRELSSRYGFAYNEQYTDLTNYTITVYPDWSLGSKGKKTGTYFTWHGADDFELITPKFSTNLTEDHRVKEEGPFKETILFMQHMEKNYYHEIAYMTYSGGDFRLQIIENRQNLTGAKILIIRDSFACVVTPFLALQTAELHVCDIRDNDYLSGHPANLRKYIQENKPDYVIVLYSGVESVRNAHGKYDFFPASQ